MTGASQAVCGSHYRYLNTEGGFTPCDIAALIKGNGVKTGSSDFPELADLGVDHYRAPNTNEANEVVCNPVFYNLVAGCAACQGGAYRWATWEEWSRHCEFITGVGKVANIAMANNIEVPNWAFIPPSLTNNTFSRVASQIEAQSNTVDAKFGGAVISMCSKNTGAIVGGSIGGILGLILIGGMVLILVRRHQPRVKVEEKGHALQLTSSADSVAKEKISRVIA